MLQAYYTAQFAWAKDAHRLLNKLLKADQKQTPEEQFFVMQQMAAVHKLKMVFRPKASHA